MQKNHLSSTAAILFLLFPLVFACSKTAGNNDMPLDAELGLTFTTRSGGSDDLVIGQENEFTNLAVYVFNHQNGDLEFSELKTSFAPETSAPSYTRSVRVTADKKAVYTLANYANHHFSVAGQTTTLAATTPKSTLDALEISSTAFSADDLPMIGKKEVDMTGTSVTATLEMERLVGRVDLHIYKAAELTGDMVELVSVDFCNQVIRSNAQYQSPVMPLGAIRHMETYTPAAGKYLAVVPNDTDYAGLTPADAEKSFYSYQHISGEDDPEAALPDESSSPYFLLHVKINGAPVTYCGYLKNKAGLYDLERNRVYRVKAVIGEPNDMLFLRIDVLEWDTELSGITYEDPVFTFSAANTAAGQGQISQTDPALYDFEFTAPAGAVWTANLTNGLDFKLQSDGGYAWQGIARTTPYRIRIDPVKRFLASEHRTTQFSISIDGKKVRINPDHAGGSFSQGRKYPGTETDILIEQIQ